MEEYIDIEPMLIILDGKQWTHPFIENWYEGEEDFKGDDEVYQICFKNVKTSKKIKIVFKSEMITKRDEEYINIEELVEDLYVTLIEDIWSPRPKNEQVSNEELSNYLLSNVEDQFCFTKFGKKVSKFFEDEVVIEFFSEEGSLYKEKEWSFTS